MEKILKYKFILIFFGGIITLSALFFFVFDIFHLDWKFFNVPVKTDQQTIIVGLDDSFPPYEYLKNGKPTGYNIDIMNAVSKASGYDVEYIAKPWNEIIDDFNNGEIDVLSGMFVTETRKEKYTFSIPHAYVTAGLFSIKNNNIHSLNDLVGKTVLVQADDVMDDFLIEQNLDVQILRANKPADVIQQLESGQADAALLSSISQGQHFVSKYLYTNIDIHTIDQSHRSYAFAALKSNKGFIDQLDQGLIHIKTTGEFDTINTKWFIQFSKNNNITLAKNIVYVLFFLLLVLIISSVWSRSLKKQVEIKTNDLIRSEAKFRTIFENASEGIAIIHNRKIIFANPKAKEIIGVSDDDLPIIDVFSKAHPLDKQRLQDYYKARFAGEPAPSQYMFRILTDNNQVRWLMNNVIMTKWDKKDVVLNFFTDITQLRESEAALERSEERQNLAMEASNDGLWDIDILAGEAYFSPRYYTMLGYQVDEFPASFKNWISLLHPDDRPRAIKTLNGYLDLPDNKSHELTFRMQTKNGNYRWILSKLKVTAYEKGTIPKRISGIHTDITRQREYEETIRKERDVLNQIMQTSNNAFIVTDRNGLTQFINPTAERLLDVKKEQALNHNFIDFNYKVFDANYSKELNTQKLLEHIRNGVDEILTIERIVETNKSATHVLVNAARLLNNEQEFDGMVISIIDITESDLFKKELIERDKQIRQIIQYSPIGIAMLDKDLNLVTVSDQFIQDFELNADIPREGNIKTFAPQVYKKWKKVFAGSLNGEKQFNLQDKYTHANGKMDYIQWNCQPWYKEQTFINGILFYTEVITDKVLAYLALQQSEDKFSKTFHTSPDAITITRLSDGYYLDVNAGFSNLTGYTHQEIIGKTSQEINIWKNYDQRLELTDLIETDGEANNFEAAFAMKDGGIRYGLLSARIIKIHQEKCLIMIVRDITEIREANEKIRKMNQELEEKIIDRTLELEKKNQELETFTYTVSHDLKAPLRGIEGYGRLLLEDYNDKLDDDGKHFLESIRSSTLHMDKLINDLLAYSRMERRALALKEIDLEELINRIIHEHVHQQKQTKLDINLQVKYIISDYESLMQIIRNLIDNAFKFSRNDIQHHVEVSSYLENDSCMIKIKDNGIGFDNKYRDNIFKIFNRLHSPEDFPGTGIGLTIVKKGVERIGGKIWADGELNKGAAFIVAIPQTQKREGNQKDE